MSWQKFSDRARESKKVRRASDAALVLWWAAGNYCCEHRTDGFFAKDELADVWRPIGRRFDHQKHAAECVAIGLLIDHGDHYEVHDFLEFNKSREDDEKRKKGDAKRAAAYRARQSAAKKLGIVTRDDARDGMSDERGDAAVTHGARHGADTRDASDTRHAPLVPSRPVPLRFEEEEGEGACAPAPSAPPPGHRPAYDLTSWEGDRGAVCFERRIAPPRGTRDQDRLAVEHVRDLALAHGVSCTDAARRLAQAALAACATEEGGLKRFPFLALTLDPFAAPAGAQTPSGRGPKTAAEETFEETRARLAAEEAARAAAERKHGHG